MYKKIRHFFEIIMLLIGTMIGAGFISGAELLQFFPLSGYIYALLFAGILFCIGFTVIYLCGRKYGGYSGILHTFFGKVHQYISILTVVASIILCASMLAGFVSALQLFLNVQIFLPLYALLLLLAIACISFKGVKAIVYFNFILVPCMLILIFAYISFPTEIVEMEMCWIDIVKIILFVTFNLFLAAPVLADLGHKHAMEEAAYVHMKKNALALERKTKKMIFEEVAIICATCIILLAAMTILENIKRCDAASMQALPFLYIMQKFGNAKLFAFVSISGILTTLFSAYYTVHQSVKQIKYANIWRTLLCILIFCLSLLGLKHIISICYPLIGIVGVYFIITCILQLFFRGKFFKNSNKTIHNAR